MPTFQSEMRNNAVASQTDRCNVRWFFTDGDFHGTLPGPGDNPAQSWFNIDVGHGGKNLHDLMVDVVEDQCVESASSVPFFDASSNVNTYCGAGVTCSSVAQRAADAGVHVDVFKDRERLALLAQEEEAKNAGATSGMDPVVAAVLAGVVSGVVAAVASTLVVLRAVGGRREQPGAGPTDTVVNPMFMTSEGSQGAVTKGHLDL
jgi:hypothetical protein